MRVVPEIKDTNEAYHVIRTGDTPTGSGQLSVQVMSLLT